MTAAAELALLEAAYEAWLTAGMPQSYTHEGRTVTRANADWMTTRIDQLRAQANRAGSSGFSVANFRQDT